MPAGKRPNVQGPQIRRRGAAMEEKTASNLRNVVSWMAVPLGWRRRGSNLRNVVRARERAWRDLMNIVETKEGTELHTTLGRLARQAPGLVTGMLEEISHTHPNRDMQKRALEALLYIEGKRHGGHHRDADR